MTVLISKLPATAAHQDRWLGLMPAVEARMQGLLNSGKPQQLLSPNLAQQAAAYHLNSGGQRIRARIAAHACTALGVLPGDGVCLAAAAELVHNASLIHDDLQDRDTTRHGIDSVWVAFGDGVAICAGDLLLSAAYAAIAGVRHPHLLPALIALLHGSIARASAGQTIDLAPQHVPAASLSSYEHLATLKSGSLLSLPLELSLVAAGQPQSVPVAQTVANAFAIGYQIFDDLNDVQKDASRQRLHPAINAVEVASRQHTGGDARSVVKQMAVRHLDEAAEASLSLPSNCGQLLRSLSLDLRQRLVSEPL
ncbi:MAG: polyprenyl synthetase family protein [Burkholderiaceae bacterium]